MIDLIRILDQDLGRGYDALGDEWDVAFVEAITALHDSNEVVKAAIRTEIDDSRSWTLLGFAQRFSVWSVRSGDPASLLPAFVALSLAGPGVIDDREIERIRALVFRSAQILGHSTKELVEKAAEMTDETGRQWLLAELCPHATPEEMAFREVGSGDTFRYENMLGSADPYEVLGDYLDEE